jgi:hypothetical protein
MLLGLKPGHLCDGISAVAVEEFMIGVAGFETRPSVDVISAVAVEEFMIDVAGFETRPSV